MIFARQREQIGNTKSLCTRWLGKEKKLSLIHISAPGRKAQKTREKYKLCFTTYIIGYILYKIHYRMYLYNINILLYKKTLLKNRRKVVQDRRLSLQVLEFLLFLELERSI